MATLRRSLTEHDSLAMDGASFDSVKLTIQNLARHHTSMRTEAHTTNERLREEAALKSQLEAELRRMTNEKIALAAIIKRNDERWKGTEFAISTGRIRDASITEIMSKIDSQLSAGECSRVGLQRRVESLEGLAEKAASRISELECATVDRDKMLRQSAALENELGNMRQRLSTLEQQLRSAGDDHQRVVQLKDKEISERAADVQRLMAQLAATGREASEKDVSVQDLQVQASALRNEADKLQQCLASKDILLSERTTELKSMQELLHQLQIRTNESKVAAEAEKSKLLQAHQEQIDHARQLQRELEAARAAVAKQELECRGLSVSLDAMKSASSEQSSLFAQERQQHRTAIESMANALEEGRTELAKKSQEVTRLNAMKAEADEMCRKAIQMKSALQQELEQLQATLHQERQMHAMEQKSVGQDLTRLTRLPELELQLRQACKKITELENEASSSSKAAAGFEKQVQQLQAQVRELSTELEKTSRQLACSKNEKEGECQALQNSLSTATKTMEDLQQTNSNISASLEAATAKIAAQQSELDQSAKTLSVLEASVKNAQSRAEADCAELRETLEKLYLSKLRESSKEAKESISKAALEFKSFQVCMEEEHARKLLQLQNSYEQKLSLLEDQLAEKETAISALQKALTDAALKSNITASISDNTASKAVTSSKLLESAHGHGQIQKTERNHANVLDAGRSASSQKRLKVEPTTEVSVLPESCNAKPTLKQSAARKGVVSSTHREDALPRESSMSSKKRQAQGQISSDSTSKKAFDTFDSTGPSRRFGSASASKGGREAKGNVSRVAARATTAGSLSSDDLFDDFGFNE